MKLLCLYLETTAQLSRQQVRQIGLAAATLDEVRKARQVLEEWQATHPSEPVMFDIFEQLFMLEDAWHSLAAELAASRSSP